MRTRASPRSSLRHRRRWPGADGLPGRADPPRRRRAERDRRRRPTGRTCSVSGSCLWRAAAGHGDVGARCRARGVRRALQYRLTDERAFDERAPVVARTSSQPAFGRARSARWPAGIAIPNPDIPNRDALPPEGAREVTGLAAAHVPAAFEPLRRGRRWRSGRTRASEASRRFVAGLAGFVTAAESRALDRALAARASRERPVEQRRDAPCEITWTGSGARFKCVGAGDSPLRVAGRVDLRGTRVAGGEVGTLEVDGATALERLEVGTGTFDANAGRASLVVGTRGTRARLADGAAIAGIALAWKPSEARARGAASEVSARVTLSTIDDFAPVRGAIAALAAEPGDETPLAARTFSRTRVLAPLFARLGVPVGEWCCEDAARFPPVTVEAPEPPMPVDGRRGPVRRLLSALRELSRDRGALAAELPRRTAGARRGEREALRTAHLRAPRAMAGRAAGARQDADAAAVRVGPRGSLRTAAGDRRARTHCVRPRARRERRGAAARRAARERVRGAPAVPGRLKGKGK